LRRIGSCGAPMWRANAQRHAADATRARRPTCCTAPRTTPDWFLAAVVMTGA
jgi:hypothetical protein